MASELHAIVETAIGSAQASIAVLLVLLAGYWAQHHGLVNEVGEQQISLLCTAIFLPALLFTQIGLHATVSNLHDYAIIIVFFIFALVTSYAIGALTHRALKGPGWTTAAFIFHNAASLPLLLVNSLEKTGTIRVIIGKHGGSVSDAVTRGRTYILIGVLMSNMFMFTLGPELMAPHGSTEDSEQHLAETERTPLLVNSRELPTSRRLWLIIKQSGKNVRARVVGALSPPLVAAIVALAFGLIAPVRHAFFGDGKFLQTTVTQSVDYLGRLYIALQIFVLGSKLRSKPGSKFPVAPALALFFHRFFLMPAIMISAVYLLRTHWPSFAKRDPMLDFVLSITGVGPPAITLAAIADMAKVDVREDAEVARILTISYVITPLICLPLSAAVYAIQQSGVANS